MERVNWDKMGIISKSIQDWTMSLVVERFKEKFEWQEYFDANDIDVEYQEEGNISILKNHEEIFPLTPKQISDMMMDSYKEISHEADKLNEVYSGLVMLGVNLQML